MSLRSLSSILFLGLMTFTASVHAEPARGIKIKVEANNTWRVIGAPGQAPPPHNIALTPNGKWGYMRKAPETKARKTAAGHTFVVELRGDSTWRFVGGGPAKGMPRIVLLRGGKWAYLRARSSAEGGNARLGSGGAKVVMKVTQARSLNKRIIENALRRRGAEFRYCYEKALARNSSLRGRLDLEIAIGPTGIVASASPRKSTVADRTVADCVVTKIRRTTFPKPPGGGLARTMLAIEFSPR